MQTIVFSKPENTDFRGKEAYKTLRTNIGFAGDDVKVISVTSCMPDEGKSSVTMNLALSLVEAGKSVLFVDADMRKSTLTGRYKIKNAKKGLSHFLSGQCSIDEVISVTNVEKFHMIVSGPLPPNPSELLQSKHFQSFIDEMRKIYDYIVIDCPPVGSVVDGLIAGRISDGVVLVIASGTISYKFAQKVKKQLENAGCRLIGVVLNKVNMRSSGYYGRYHEKYYDNEYYANED